jgi:hypothetical protein
VSFRCDQCDRAVSGAPAATTATGRDLCERCNDEFLGLAAGMMAGAGDADGGVGNAISTAGWFSWIKRFRRSGS